MSKNIKKIICKSVAIFLLSFTFSTYVLNTSIAIYVIAEETQESEENAQEKSQKALLMLDYLYTNLPKSEDSGVEFNYTTYLGYMGRAALDGLTSDFNDLFELGSEIFDGQQYDIDLYTNEKLNDRTKQAIINCCNTTIGYESDSKECKANQFVIIKYINPQYTSAWSNAVNEYFKHKNADDYDEWRGNVEKQLNLSAKDTVINFQILSDGDGYEKGDHVSYTVTYYIQSFETYYGYIRPMLNKFVNGEYKGYTYMDKIKVWDYSPNILERGITAPNTLTQFTTNFPVTIANVFDKGVATSVDTSKQEVLQLGDNTTRLIQAIDKDGNINGQPVLDENGNVTENIFNTYITDGDSKKVDVKDIEPDYKINLPISTEEKPNEDTDENLPQDNDDTDDSSVGFFSRILGIIKDICNFLKNSAKALKEIFISIKDIAKSVASIFEIFPSPIPQLIKAGIIIFIIVAIIGFIRG